MTQVESAVALLEAFRTGDRPAIDSLLHPEATWWLLGRGEVETGPFLDMICQAAGTLASQPMTIVGTTCEGDRVAVEATGNMSLPDGTPYCNNYHFLMRFRDGRIIEGKEYLDTALVREVFGDTF